MRFAFKTANQSTTWPDVLEVWRAADQIEIFESGWNFDHFYPIDGNAGGPCLEGWMMLAALAQATKRLRMGTMVTGIHYRHPAVLANMIATLDIISSEITLSSHVKFDPAVGASATADAAAALGEAGLDLAIVYLRPPLTPAVLEPLAAAFAQIG